MDGYIAPIIGPVADVRFPDAGIASPLLPPHDGCGRALVVAFSSDGSRCGAFNANAVTDDPADITPNA